MYTDSDGYLALPSIGSIVKGFTNLAGFAWDNSQGIWYSLMNPWQRNLGYCELYNTMAPLSGMIIANKKITFNYDSKTWRVWLWKGLYGITTGAEIGVYIYSKTYSVSYFGKTAKMDWYRYANDSERLSMSFTLYKNGKKLFSRPYQLHCG